MRTNHIIGYEGTDFSGKSTLVAGAEVDITETAARFSDMVRLGAESAHWPKGIHSAELYDSAGGSPKRAVRHNLLAKHRAETAEALKSKPEPKPATEAAKGNKLKAI